MVFALNYNQTIDNENDDEYKRFYPVDEKGEAIGSRILCFEEDIKAGEFLEYAMVHGNYYGTSLKLVNKALSEDKLVIFDIDIQGHRLVEAKMGDLVTSAFITPSTLIELEKRLYARSTDDISIIEKRVANARDEIKAINEFDFVIINDDIEKATPIEKPWVQCPVCADAFEAPSNRKYIECPKCKTTMHNPYFEGYK